MHQRPENNWGTSGRDNVRPRARCSKMAARGHYGSAQRQKRQPPFPWVCPGGAARPPRALLLPVADQAGHPHGGGGASTTGGPYLAGGGLNGARRAGWARAGQARWWPRAGGYGGRGGGAPIPRRARPPRARASWRPPPWPPPPPSSPFFAWELGPASNQNMKECELGNAS